MGVDKTRMVQYFVGGKKTKQHVKNRSLTKYLYVEPLHLH